MEVINTIGRRKTSVARIYLTQGEGKITVNKKNLDDYFPSAILRTIINQPLELTNEAGNYDVKVNVQGGGITGQAEAVRLAIAKAMCEINAEHRLVLKPEGLLTRDPRMVERKKPGRRKARRKFQFSKR
ncbi:30S ribosomal protein S9 [Algivirga pacifica]|uniref:Small ribosomal subunit protein uS9 n=1 Tax=Algivirga pacifica TaxID=1162670 RepID=A0ABP9DFX6_9BACT